eukprot:292623-Pleurochrysis_carterae.AAC.1
MGRRRKGEGKGIKGATGRGGEGVRRRGGGQARKQDDKATGRGGEETRRRGGKGRGNKEAGERASKSEQE